jgi:hypothetical protein
VNEDVWSPLSDTDPIPGDPWKVNELATHFGEQAEKIRDMVTALKKVQPDDIKSVYIDSMIERRDEVIPDLKLLAERYATSGEALKPYANALDDAQEMAKQARSDSWAAHRRLTDAQQALAAANPTVIGPGTGPAITAPAPVGPVITAGQPDYEEEIRLARADLEKAENLLDEARERRDNAAGRARHLLDDANHDDLKNPNRGFFAPLSGIADSFKDLGKNLVTVGVAGVIAAHKLATDFDGSLLAIAKWTLDSFSSLENFSSHLGLIGGALGLAALFFPPTSLIATIGFAISATKLGVDTYLAATGKASWGDVTLGAIGMATFGAARVAATASRTRALRDAQAAIKNYEKVASAAADGLTAVQKGNLARAEGIVSTLTEQANANASLSKMTRFANVIKDPGAPTKELLEFSKSAQQFARVNTAVDIYNKVDDPIGKVGSVAGWADEMEPMAKPITKEFFP